MKNNDIKEDQPPNAPSLPLPFGDFLSIDESNDADQTIPDDVTELTSSSVWYVRNSLLLNPRAYYGHFERGNFNMYESHFANFNDFIKPFLPRAVRIILENLRIISLSTVDVYPRCLHFPVQYDELHYLLLIVSNLNRSKHIIKNRAIFAMRTAAITLPGRVSFDAARIFQEFTEQGKNIADDKTGIFSIQQDQKSEHSTKMTSRTVNFSPKLGKSRAIALYDRTVVIASEKMVNVIDTQNKRNIAFPVGNTRKVLASPNGNFLACSHNGQIYEIDVCSGVNISMKQIANINQSIDDFKISSGGENTYAAIKWDRKALYYGLYEKNYQFTSEEPIVDFDIINEDVYIASDKTIKYFSQGREYNQWEINKQIVSISVDPMSSIIGCCTSNGCYMIDSRTPYILGLGLQDCKNLVSFHMSPYMDLAVCIKANGIAAIDIRQPNLIQSNITIPQSPVDIKGEWMPESRLFAAACIDTFLIDCPYLQKPILECYRLPAENVVNVRSNLKISVVQQEHSVTFFGGYGYNFSVPSVL